MTANTEKPEDLSQNEIVKLIIDLLPSVVRHK